MNRIPKTLLKATDNTAIATDRIMLSAKDIESNGQIYAFNVSDKLIEEVGRFCELHKTDFLITWDTLIQHIKTDDEGIYYFGIRKWGVDHNCYVFINLRDHVHDYSYTENYYRKLYAVEFHRNYDERTYDYIPVDVYLKDMTGLRFDKDDEGFDVETIDRETE